MAITNRNDLFLFHGDLCNKALALMKKKNADYGGEVDPFYNFQTHGVLGFLVRMHDKLCRLESFRRNGSLQVQDESVEDTLVDLINYAVLLAAFIRSKKGSAAPFASAAATPQTMEGDSHG